MKLSEFEGLQSLTTFDNLLPSTCVSMVTGKEDFGTKWPNHLSINYFESANNGAILVRYICKYSCLKIIFRIYIEGTKKQQWWIYT